MPMEDKFPLLVARRHKSGRIDGFDELRRKPVNRNVEIVPGLPGKVPQLLHLNIWPGAIVPPSPANPLGLPNDVTLALAFFTRKPGPKITKISPLVRTKFKIWDKTFTIPGLTVTQREHLRAAVDLEVLNASVPPPSMGVATDLRGRLLLTLAPSTDPRFIIGALSVLRGVKLVEPVTALYGPQREEVQFRPKRDPVPLAIPPLAMPPAKVATPPVPWMHQLINRDSSWNNTKAVNIAILDSGAMASHPSLVGAVATPDGNWFPYDLDDQYGHGTHVTSLIVGRTVSPSDPLAQFVPQGVLPKSTALCFNIFDPTPSGTHFGLDISAFFTALYTIRLIYPAIAVINMSIWMKDDPGMTLLEEFAEVESEKTVMVACAGNYFDPPTESDLGIDSAYRVLYPARLPNFLSVGAINSDSERAWWSRFSTWNTDGRDGNDYFAADAGRWPMVDVVAPGAEVWGAAAATAQTLASIIPDWVSTNQQFGAVKLWGTSMAAPYVTAAVAAVRSKTTTWGKNKRSAAEVRQLIRGGVRIPAVTISGIVKKSELYGTGLLDYPTLMSKAI